MQRTTLLLILPPQQALLEGFSSGLISLANFVADREPAVDVQILDLSYTAWDDLKGELSEQLTHKRGRLIIGITTTTATYQAACEVARQAAELEPEAIIVLGGHHASPEAASILTPNQGQSRGNHNEISAIICGEGETALLELVRNPDNFERVPNLVYRDDGQIRFNPRGALLSVADLDTISASYLKEGIRSAHGKFNHISYVSARGCPLRCAFCAVANEKIRAKSVGRVTEDLRRLVKDFGYRQIAIEDNFFAHAPARTIELCRALENLRREPGMNFTWDAQTRVESLESPQIVNAMQRAGCEAVYMGVESLNEDQLLKMRKASNPSRYLHSLETIVVPQLLRSNVDCYINLQLGIPGETEKHRETTLRRLERLGQMALSYRKRIVVFPMLSVVYPGTADYLTALALGGALHSFKAGDAFEKFTRWEQQQQPVLRWLGDHFAHGTGGIPLGILDESLRQGKFRVNIESVFQIVNHLGDLRKIDGIQVFDYSRHLVASKKSSLFEKAREHDELLTT